MTTDNQRRNVARACEHLARIATGRELVVSHGNGPQIGLLALEEAAYGAVSPQPLDVLGAETQGMVGYLIERELTNRLPAGWPLATVLTIVEVDPADPAFADPTKPIGPQYRPEEARVLEHEEGWAFRPDGDLLRRVVPSPAPRRIVEVDRIAALLDTGAVVICAGGGGIPTARDADGRLHGVEAVVDKDLASCLLAIDLGADVLVMATDTPAAYLDFGREHQAAVMAANPEELLSAHAEEFASGSMLPKVTAACEFARVTGNTAVVGQLADIEALVAGSAGTRISTAVTGVQTAPASTGRGGGRWHSASTPKSASSAR